MFDSGISMRSEVIAKNPKSVWSYPVLPDWLICVLICVVPACWIVLMYKQQLYFVTVTYAIEHVITLL